MDTSKRIGGALLAALLLQGFVCPVTADELDEEPDGGVDDMDGGMDEVDTGPDVVAPLQDEVDTEDDDWGDDAVWDESAGVEAGEALSKAGVRIHGVFENQLQGMLLRKDDGGSKALVNDYTKLRVDVDADLAGGIALRADGVVRIFTGDTEVSLENLIPEGTRNALTAADPRWEPFMDEAYTFENDYYLDNAYLKVPVGPLSLIVGKQPLSQGVGYVWNPTDIFTKKDLFDPSYEKPGIIALRAVAAVGEKVTLDAIAVPKDGFENWIGGARAAVTAGPLQLSAVAYVTTVEAQDVSGSMDAMMAAALLGENPETSITAAKGRRVMVGGEVVADIEGVRLWTEGAYNFIEDKEVLPDDYLEIVGGVEYFFRSETHLMVEYLHYGKGPTQQNGIYTYNDWMGALAYNYKMLGQNFLFESIDQPVADFWTLGLSSFQSISDASAAIMADVKWQFREDAELWLLVSGAVGEPDDYLSSARGQAWLRLTAYF